MRMDTLSWTSLTPAIKIVGTKKKFYGLYLYKIVLRVPGARLIAKSIATGSDVPMADVLAEQITTCQYASSYNYSWTYSRRLHELRAADSDQLDRYRALQQKAQPSVIKFRIEEPNLTIYSNDESALYSIAQADPTSLKEVHRPVNAQAQAILERGEVIVNHSMFSHKVVLRGSDHLDINTRETLYNYLVNLGDTVALTRSCVTNLSQRKLWFTTCYFYTKDESVLTFVKLIAPNAISGIYKLSELSQ